MSENPHRTYTVVTKFGHYKPASRFERATITVRGELLHEGDLAMHFSLYVILDSDTWDFDWWEEYGVLADEDDPGIDSDEMRHINALIEEKIVNPVRDGHEQYIGHLVSIIQSNNLALVSL
jgi:hypothetical protein